ncbi:hypothetical protein AWU82_28365 [Pseudomonas glycinae]|uniref:Uncharacterized protein n=1 Tax=Pseudomonas glycinae TaxID=1785145 RepID=A0ABM6QHH6_9PSED|nr:hypothetical protein AWU82_28365 [Pseudomonas glycinae]
MAKTIIFCLDQPYLKDKLIWSIFFSFEQPEDVTIDLNKHYEKVQRLEAEILCFNETSLTTYEKNSQRQLMSDTY